MPLSTAGDGLFNRAFNGRQAGQLWGLRGPHRRFVVVMLRAVAFRRADLAHLRRRRLPRLAHLGRYAFRYWRSPFLPGGTCVRACVRSRLAVVWDIPARIGSVVARGPLRSQTIDGDSAAGFCRSSELDGLDCPVIKGPSGWRGSQVARSLPIRVRSLVCRHWGRCV